VDVLASKSFRKGKGAYSNKWRVNGRGALLLSIFFHAYHNLVLQITGQQLDGHASWVIESGKTHRGLRKRNKTEDSDEADMQEKGRILTLGGGAAKPN